MSLGGRKSLYDVLGVPFNASKQEIKSQFYRLSLLYHPDRPSLESNSDWRHEKFIQISEAYSILSNELKRRDYDRKNFINHQKPMEGRANYYQQPKTVWNSYHGARHSSMERERRPIWERHHNASSKSWSQYDRRGFIINETTRRWARWAENSHSMEEELRKFQNDSKEQQRRDSMAIRNRFIALIITLFTFTYFTQKLER